METQKLEFTRTSSTEIILGSQILQDLVGKIVRGRFTKKVAVVTNEVVARWYLAPLVAELRTRGVETCEIILPDGEPTKTIENAAAIVERLYAFQADRKSPVVAVGGGVICDLTGFAASIFKRGIPYIQMPTSLLAMLDACIGGKTGVNIPGGKNIVGTFYQPVLTAIDVSTLKTLPLTQLSYGLTEAIKHGVIADGAYYKFILRSREEIKLREPELMQRLVRRSINIKRSIVEQDELDVGIRGLLNLGHTFAHGFETYGQYVRFHHGEAVGIGMLCALRASRALGVLKEDFSESLQELLKEFGLPTSVPREWSAKELAAIIINDKKCLTDKINFVLPVSLGKAVVYPVPVANLEKLVQYSIQQE